MPLVPVHSCHLVVFVAVYNRFASGAVIVCLALNLRRRLCSIAVRDNYVCCITFGYTSFDDDRWHGASNALVLERSCGCNKRFLLLVENTFLTVEQDGILLPDESVVLVERLLICRCQMLSQQITIVCNWIIILACVDFTIPSPALFSHYVLLFLGLLLWNSKRNGLFSGWWVGWLVAKISSD